MTNHDDHDDDRPAISGREFFRRYWILIAAVVIGLAAGISLDIVAGSTPWLSITMPVLALIFAELIRLRRVKLDRNARRGHDDNVTGLPRGGYW